MASDSIEQIRDIVEGDVGYADLSAMTLEPGLPVHSVAGLAESQVRGAIMCFIVEKDAEARHLLEKADAWLNLASNRVRAGEHLGLTFQMIFHRALVVCRWLLESPAEQPDLTRLNSLLRERLLSHPRDGLREELDRYLPLLLAVGEVDFCIEQFERLRPGSPPTFSRPTPTGMAYLLALRQTPQGLPSDADLPALAQSFLTRHLPQMLDDGDYFGCALWAQLLMPVLFPPPADVRPGEALRRTVVDHVG